MFVYTMTNKPDGTLDVGVTNDLVRWVHEHRTYAAPDEAIRRDKVLMRWNRAWKVAMIEKANVTWRDLWHELVGSNPTTKMTESAHP